MKCQSQCWALWIHQETGPGPCLMDQSVPIMQRPCLNSQHLPFPCVLFRKANILLFGNAQGTELPVSHCPGK